MKINIECDPHLFIDDGHLVLELYFGDSSDPEYVEQTTLENILRNEIHSYVIPSPEGDQIRETDRKAVMRSLKKLRKQIDSVEKCLLSIKKWDKNDW